jgi:two-component system chemotaxis response regulator CheB
MVSNPAHQRTRDIVVIGCSAGGVEALPRVVHVLRHDLQAAVFIVQHLSPSHTPYLVDIISRTASLPVCWAEQGANIEYGKIYVSPPDVHMVFNDDHIGLTKGARENHARPSIDKLFRSAAATYGSRVIGVLMTGMLDDGVSGLRAIRAAGGLVIVQDPNDADYPDLPGRALLVLEPDRTLPADAIGLAITSLVGQQVSPAPIPADVGLEASLDSQVLAEPQDLHSLGRQTSISCPECAGPMWELGDERTRRYRCYLGHVATARTLLAENTTQTEAALWSAVRALHDRATTLQRLAADAEKLGNHQTAESYAGRARDARTQADLARTFMFDLGQPPRTK